MDIISSTGPEIMQGNGCHSQYGSPDNAEQWVSFSVQVLKYLRAVGVILSTGSKIFSGQ